MVQVLLGLQDFQVSSHPLHTHTYYHFNFFSTVIQLSLHSLALSVKVLRETQVFLAQLAALVSPVQKETMASLVYLVLQATLVLLGLPDWLCKAPKDSKDLQDHLEDLVKNRNSNSHQEYCQKLLPGFLRLN